MTTDERARVERCGSHEIRGDRPTGYTCSLPPGHSVDHQAFSDSGWRVASWPVQPDELPEWERELLERVDPETGLLPPEQTVPRPSEAMIAAKWARLVSANEQLRRQHEALRQRVEKAEAERDEAIAHDRQPYPTAWAYEQACKALEKHRTAAAEARAERDAIAATLERTAANRDAIAKTLDRLYGEVEALADRLSRLAVDSPIPETLRSWEATLRTALDPAHKAPTTAPPSTVADQNPPVPQEGTDTPQAVQDDPGARERASGGLLEDEDGAPFPEDVQQAYRLAVADLRAGHPWHDPSTIDHLAAMQAVIQRTEETLAAVRASFMQDATPRDPKAEGSRPDVDHRAQYWALRALVAMQDEPASRARDEREARAWLRAKSVIAATDAAYAAWEVEREA